MSKVSTLSRPEQLPPPMTRLKFETHSKRPLEGELCEVTQRCHPDGGLKVGYSWEDKTAWLGCAKCGAFVARLLLAVDVPS